MRTGQVRASAAGTRPSSLPRQRHYPARMDGEPAKEQAKEGSGAAGADTERPILAVDVDGVISLFGFEDPFDDPPGLFQLIDGIIHCIMVSAGERLRRLSEHYELVWASGWEDRANEHLPRLLGLPEELPVLRFDGPAQFGTAHWKLGAIDAYAGQRPLAWVDDSIDEECRAWAEEREAPTLLVRTESSVGLQDDHVENLLSWVEDGYTPG
jgi:Swiss Army Knife RNA repair-like protein